ncbi:hypothetical protein FUMI01_06350 [Flavobacterium sp. UMI-01]|nr:hypothetical protein FUMI01_06350 [Flavobacterium sp. UMI-01]
MSEVINSNFKSAFDLYDLETEAIPKLLHPFLQKVGLASLVGTSDSGKSTFLRQLSLAIVFKQETFLGFKIDGTTHKVLYVSTEDDANAVSYAIRKQVNQLYYENDSLEKSLLKNLEFLFETENLLSELKYKLENDPVDLIVIDAFTDVFTKELNSNIQVRQFLNEYDKLAKSYGCLILFLHHIGKSTMRNTPSKDSIIGSQAFEAKMRVVLEIRPHKYNTNFKDLWVLKANFLEAKLKAKSSVLAMDENLIFYNTGEKSEKNYIAKTNNTQLIEKVLALYREGHSFRKIEEMLKDTEFKISKSAVAEIIKKYSN